MSFRFRTPPIWRTPARQCIRHLHRNMPIPTVPPPIPFVPDPQTFLTVIGRGLSQHAAKIPTWEALFTLTSQQLRELGVEPARSRRYLLHWREKYRNGEFGVGGDFTDVTDGVAELRVVEVPVKNLRPDSPLAKATATRSAGMRKIVVNVPRGSTKPAVPLEEAKSVSFVNVRGAQTIYGPHVEPLPGTAGSGARIVAKEGVWEHRRGHKVDGGERRKAEVRFKRRSAERRAARG